MAEVMFQVQCKLLYEAKHESAIDFGVDSFSQEGYLFLKRFRQVWQRGSSEIYPVHFEQGDRFLEEFSAKVRMLGVEVRQSHQLVRLSSGKRTIALSHIFERVPYRVQVHGFEVQEKELSPAFLIEMTAC